MATASIQRADSSLQLQLATQAQACCGHELHRGKWPQCAEQVALPGPPLIGGYLLNDHNTTVGCTHWMLLPESFLAAKEPAAAR